jgi:nitrogen-specific signal transduction histidine kinase
VNVYLTDHPPLVEVHDHGSGLPDDLEASWGEIQSTRRPGGHGLGLLISKRLAKKNAATLSYERLPHGTTVFGLKLPNPPA